MHWSETVVLRLQGWSHRTPGPAPGPAWNDQQRMALGWESRTCLRSEAYGRGGWGLRGWSSHASWPTCVDAHVILVIGGAGEAAATVGLGAGVGPLARVGAHMYLADIRRGEGAATALEGASERAFTCGDGRVRTGGVWLSRGGMPEQEAGRAPGPRSTSERGKAGRAQPTGVGPDVLLQVSRGLEGLAAQLLWALVRLLSSVGAHMTL